MDTSYVAVGTVIYMITDSLTCRPCVQTEVLAACEDQHKADGPGVWLSRPALTTINPRRGYQVAANPNTTIDNRFARSMLPRGINARE